MKNVVDSCGWLEYFAGGPNCDFFAPAIEHAAKLVVPSISILEVFKRIYLQRGEDAAVQAASAMKCGIVVPLDLPLSLAAARLGAELKLPLADSVILATARTHKAILWTQDADFKGIEGVRFVSSKARD